MPRPRAITPNGVNYLHSHGGHRHGSAAPAAAVLKRKNSDDAKVRRVAAKLSVQQRDLHSTTAGVPGRSSQTGDFAPLFGLPREAVQTVTSSFAAIKSILGGNSTYITSATIILGASPTTAYFNGTSSPAYATGCVASSTRDYTLSPTNSVTYSFASLASPTTLIAIPTTTITPSVVATANSLESVISDSSSA
ncbi:hypothetical protein P7C70_g3572, partial [Phenoliferia sp. Uapishka_3]